MHTELNVYAMLRDRERQSNDHMKEGLRLRALAGNDRSARGGVINSRQSTSALRSNRRSWLGLLRRNENRSVAAA